MDANRQFEIRFEGRFANSQLLPVAALAKVLEAMQRAVHLLAMQHEKIEVRQRDRITKEIEVKYPLLCSIPKPGSYIVPVEIGDISLNLFAKDDIEAVGGLFTDCCQYIATGDKASLSKNIPDTIRRDRFVESVRSMAPSQGSGIKAEIFQPLGQFRVSLESLHTKSKECLSTAADPERLVRTITGRFSGIDFDARTIKIVYPANDRELACSYVEALEEMLLDYPRELVQVTGEITFDLNELPSKIFNVEAIDVIDLSPVYLDTIELGTRKFELTPTLELTPELDETKQLYGLENTTLGIDVFAYTRDQLIQELKEQLVFMWDSYALADDGELTDAAQQLKKNLLQALKEVIDAA